MFDVSQKVIWLSIIPNVVIQLQVCFGNDRWFEFEDLSGCHKNHAGEYPDEYANTFKIQPDSYFIHVFIPCMQVALNAKNQEPAQSEKRNQNDELNELLGVIPPFALQVKSKRNQ
jgi:hypothetical protein